MNQNGKIINSTNENVINITFFTFNNVATTKCKMKFVKLSWQTKLSLYTKYKNNVNKKHEENYTYLFIDSPSNLKSSHQQNLVFCQQTESFN